MSEVNVWHLDIPRDPHSIPERNRLASVIPFPIGRRLDDAGTTPWELPGFSAVVQKHQTAIIESGLESCYKLAMQDEFLSDITGMTLYSEAEIRAVINADNLPLACVEIGGENDEKGAKIARIFGIGRLSLTTGPIGRSQVIIGKRYENGDVEPNDYFLDEHVELAAQQAADLRPFGLSD